MLQGKPDFEVGLFVYHVFWGIQILFATFYSIMVGPPLVAKDMANNALPLYFSKALRRSDYILGKALVLVCLISLVSWIPLGLISLFHYAMASETWRANNGGTFFSIFCASAVLIVAFTTIILAVSATVQRTRHARAALFAIFVLSAAFGGMLSGATRQDGFLSVSPVLMVKRVGEWAFDSERVSPRTGELVGRTVPVTRGLALGSLATWTALAGFVVARRIRPAEEVK
jgi:ABC-2 type transport system permease protein